MPPPQDNARVVFLIILLFWVATSPDNGPGFVAAPSLTRARLARQRHAHGVLNTTDWGAFAPHLHLDDDKEDPPPPPDLDPGKNITIPTGYLNLTGFRKEDGLAWDDLGRFKSRCEAWSRNAVGDPESQSPVWQNVSGVVKGPWVRRNASVSRVHGSYNLTAMTPGIEWVGRQADWLRNATGSEGTMMLRIEDEEEAGTDPERPRHRKGLLTPAAEVIAREVSATVTIDDDKGTGASFDMRLHGVHWPRQGALLLTTTSEKFAGIFGLPHLTTRPDFYESSKSLLNRTLDEVLQRKEKRTFSDPINPWAASLDSPGEGWTPAPHCEYVAYIQIHPPDKDILQVDPMLTGPGDVAKAIEDLEFELRFPRGAPQQRHPKLQMSAVMFSPDCAFFLETRGPPEFTQAEGLHLVGWKQEFWLHSVSTWLLGFALVIFCQVQLLKMQIKETSTPSTLGRVSFYTTSIILLADGVTFLGSSAWSLSASTTMLPSLVVTVASFLAMIVSVAFLIEIFKVQEPEWRRQERERQRTSAANTPRPPETLANTTTTTPPDANADTVSNTILSTAARRANPRPPSPPIIISSDQDIDAEIEEVTGGTTAAGLPAPATAANATAAPPAGPTVSTIFGRFILIGIGILFLSLAAITWRPHIRTTYFNLLAFSYLSLWVPQIYRNIYRNCRRAFSWRFVVGQSVLRLLPISYFYTAKDNFAFAEPDWTAFAVLAGWLWIQIWVLVGQNVLGPRFGLPKDWMPEAWEYHPILREDNVESGGLPIGLVSVSAPGSPSLERRKSGGDESSGAGAKPTTKIHVIDCAICREVLEVPVIKSGEADPTAVGGVAGVFARRVYMVTPCRHIFHSECLEGWMRFRLQCPICREELPPL